MRYKLEVPISARLANHQFFRRFRASSTDTARARGLGQVGVVYGATLGRGPETNRRADHDPR